MLKMLKDTKSDSSTDFLKWQGKTLPDYEDGQGPCWQVAPGEVAWAGRYPRDVHPAFPGWPPLAVRRARLIHHYKLTDPWIAFYFSPDYLSYILKVIFLLGYLYRVVILSSIYFP